MAEPTPEQVRAAARQRDQLERAARALSSAAIIYATASRAGESTRAAREAVELAAKAFVAAETTAGIAAVLLALALPSRSKAGRQLADRFFTAAKDPSDRTPSDERLAVRLADDAINDAEHMVGRLNAKRDDDGKPLGQDVLTKQAENWSDMVARTMATRHAAERAISVLPVVEDEINANPPAQLADKLKPGQRAKLTKVWATRGDSRVRDLHRKLHGRTADVGKPFYRWLGTGQELAFPGDPRAPLDAIIGCRCSLVFVLESEKAKAEEVLAPVDYGASFPKVATLTS